MLKKVYRLKKKKEFSYVYKKGKKYVGNYVSIYRRKNASKKIGCSISKKIGNAVVRNRHRRRFQHIMKKYLPLIPKGDYIIVANKRINDATYLQLDVDILFLICKIKREK